MDTMKTLKAWDDFVGQDDIKRRLEIRIGAAVNNARPLSHVLLTAAPGHGKTTLAGLIADKLGGAYVPMVAPIIKQTVVKTVQAHQDVPLTIFIDEIHLMSKRDQEDYLTLLEEGFIEYEDERIYHPHLTVIAGTTRRDALIPALNDRFPIRPVFDDYTDETLVAVVEKFAERAGIDLDEDTVKALARAAGGVPRKARGLVEAARDIPGASAADILDLAGVAPDGIDLEQFKYLKTLADAPSNRLGLDRVASAVKVTITTVRAEIEPLLLKRGYVEILPNGRAITDEGLARVKEGM